MLKFDTPPNQTVLVPFLTKNEKYDPKMGAYHTPKIDIFPIFINTASLLLLYLRHAKTLFLSGNLILAKRIPDNLSGRFYKLRAIRVKISVHEYIEIGNLYNFFSNLETNF